MAGRGCPARRESDAGHLVVIAKCSHEIFRVLTVGRQSTVAGKLLRADTLMRTSSRQAAKPTMWFACWPVTIACAR